MFQVQQHDGTAWVTIRKVEFRCTALVLFRDLCLTGALARVLAPSGRVIYE